MLALLLAACPSIARSPGAAQPRFGASDDASPALTIEGVDGDAELYALLRDAASRARRDVEVWGPLRAPVRLVVHPDHAALERVIHRSGLPWLRAWAQYDRIDLQSPRTFGHRDLPPVLRELLAHELTHVAMYQRIGTRDSWSRVWVPFWFREGMASWTARQGYRRGSLASLGRRLRALDRPLDPLLDAETLVGLDQPLAYGAAHWGFDRLLAEQGQATVRALLDDVERAEACARPASNPAPDQGPWPGSGADAARVDCSDHGAGFGQAFERRTGESEVAFAARFRRDLLAASRLAGTAGQTVARAGHRP